MSPPMEKTPSVTMRQPALSGTLRSFCSRSSISLCLKRSIFPKDSLQPSYKLAWFSRSMIT